MTGTSNLLNTFIFCLIAASLQNIAYAQVTLGARELSMGQATTALSESNWSIFANPAMSGHKKPTVSFFGVRYYGLEDLMDMAVAASLPTEVGAFGFGVHRFGNELYNESRLRFSYKHIYQGFHFGAAINYNHVSIGGGYGTVGAMGVDVGLAANIIDGLWLGAKATNVNQPNYGTYSNGREELARDLSIGLSYRLSKLALFSTDVVKDVRFPISYRAGVEISILESLKGRAGITTEPVTFAGGFGYESNIWAVNLVVQQHENPVLGLSPGFDLRLSW